MFCKLLHSPKAVTRVVHFGEGAFLELARFVWRPKTTPSSPRTLLRLPQQIVTNTTLNHGFPNAFTSASSQCILCVSEMQLQSSLDLSLIYLDGAEGAPSLYTSVRRPIRRLGSGTDKHETASSMPQDADLHQACVEPYSHSSATTPGFATRS